MFEEIQPRGVDALMALNEAFKADPRTKKVDLVVGVYKDNDGAVPVMRAVKSAEAALLSGEETKNYVGVPGDPGYRALVPQVLLGENATQIAEDRVAVVQTPGGSGALRVGCEILNSVKPGVTLWVSTPTWANHVPIANASGLTVQKYPYFRPSDRGLDFEGMMAHLDANAKHGDVILLHACCHNPTGVDLDFEQWKTVTDLVVDRGLIPYVDCAYQGLGKGMEEDVAGLRHIAAHVPEILIASSFSKNFGLYRERVGALTMIARTPDERDKVFGAANVVIRPNYSMPPSHGARVVATVFSDPAMKADWAEELEVMRNRIAEVRQQLHDKLKDRQVQQNLAFVTDQTGMFSYTGFTPEQVSQLREEYGIYTAGDGRINVAGLTDGNVDYVAEGFAAVMSRA